jgi:colicin import membrane protein
MENRSLSVVAGLIVLLALPCAALAAESGVDAELQAAWQERLDRAAAMQAESAARQAAAEKLLEEKYTVCAKKFLVNDCRNAAYKEYLKTTHETRRAENEGKALEREVKKEQVREREKQRAEEAPSRDTSLRLRQAETATARQATDEKIAASRASKAAKAAKGEQRKAADAAKYQKRQADHDARVAKKMRQAEQRAAEAAAKAQAKAQAKADAKVKQ